MKTARQLERHFKGIANHWRIEILLIIAKNKGISLEKIAEKLECNIKTVSERTKKLAQSGLVEKSYKGREVRHALSPYGKIFHAFMHSFK